MFKNRFYISSLFSLFCISLISSTLISCGSSESDNGNRTLNNGNENTNTSINCPEGQVPENGKCVDINTECKKTGICDLRETAKCKDAQTRQACEAGFESNGCGTWVEHACEGNTTCEGTGICKSKTVDCTQEGRCEIGTPSKCKDSNSYEVCEKGTRTDGCGAWTEKNCSNGAECSGEGKCSIKQQCQPNKSSCSKDGNTVVRCNAEGTVLNEVEDCNLGCAINPNGGAGYCRCVPNTLTCQSNALLECSVQGKYEQKESCEKGCTDNKCRICAVNEQSCSGDTLKKCADDGQSFVESRSCAYGCNVDGTTCADACTGSIMADFENGDAFFDGASANQIITIQDAGKTNHVFELKDMNAVYRKILTKREDERVRINFSFTKAGGKVFISLHQVGTTAYGFLFDSGISRIRSAKKIGSSPVEFDVPVDFSQTMTLNSWYNLEVEFRGLKNSGPTRYLFTNVDGQPIRGLNNYESTFTSGNEQQVLVVGDGAVVDNIQRIRSTRAECETQIEPCVPGEQRCFSPEIRQCSSNGDYWNQKQFCDFQCNEKLECLCRSDKSIGENFCSSSGIPGDLGVGGYYLFDLYTCNSDHVKTLAKDCAWECRSAQSSAEISACAEDVYPRCIPDDLECTATKPNSPGSIVRCSSDGASWLHVQSCYGSPQNHCFGSSSLYRSCVDGGSDKEVGCCPQDPRGDTIYMSDPVGEIYYGTGSGVD